MKKFLALLLSALMVLSCFAGMTFTISAEDADNGDWVVDLSTIEGNTTWPDAGYNTPILKVGYDTVFSFGEVDLSKYSSVIVEYSYDGDNVRGDGRTPEQCFTECSIAPIIGFTALDKCFGYANVVNQDAISSGISTAMEYTTGSWAAATRTATVPCVDYKGPVNLSVFNPWGTEVVVSSVKFVAKAPAGGEETPDETPDEPVLEDKVFALGVRAQGGPYISDSSMKFGQRYNIGEDTLKNISITNMATYSDGNVNTWSFKVWQWNTDYATTVAAEPLFSTTGENHADNTTFSMDISADLGIKGDIYYEIEYLTGSARFTGWTADSAVAEGVETYVAGEKKDGTYAATMTVVGVPAGPDPNETTTDCTYAYDFSKYYTDVAAEMGVNPGPEGFAHITPLANSGYETFVSTGGDPYVIFTKAPTVPASQTDYVVIKYRTSTPNAAGEIFTGRADGLNWAAPMEKTHVDFEYVADGQWHTLIIDATGIWGDSTSANLVNFRLDFLKSEGSVDVSYIKFFATLEGAEACVANETKEVALSGEYIDGDDAIIMVGGNGYGADKWVKLSQAAATQSFAGDATQLSICADEVRYTVDGTLTKWCTQEAFNYIASINGQILDVEGAYDSISFRGWANPSVADIDIDMYGYAINDGEPVFDAAFWLDEPTLRDAVGAGAERFENIEIPTADLPEGVYNIYLLMKDTNGVIYCMNSAYGPVIQYVKGNATPVVSDYPYVDAEGNGYTAREDGVLLDANGIDTGMHLFIDDEGTPYGAAHYFLMTYQDPAAGAVEIDGVKYTYTTATPLVPKMDPVLPEDNSVAPETLPANVAGMSPDTLYIDGSIVQSGGAHDYIANVLGGKILDIDKTMTSFSLHGWTKDDATQQTVAEYGYQLNDMEPVWSADWINDGSDINAVFGITYGSRYKIDIDVTALAEGTYNVYPLVKLADGTVQYLNVWGSVKYVKGGSWIQVGYTDGTNTYVKAEDGSVTINGEAATGKMLITDDGAVYYDGVAELGEGAKGKYLYDVTLTYTETPEIPVNPAELNVVYVVDGEALNPNGGLSCESEGYSYENGYITLTSTTGDPNSTNFLVPAGTKIGRYMVVKYRTSVEGAMGEVFVGAGGGAQGATDNTQFNYVADGEWNTLVVDIGNVADWPANGVVNHFRNDFLRSQGSIDIEYYAFFDTLKEANYYAENDLHELPKPPVYYTITFVADGEVVKEIQILEGTTTVKAPKVPEKEGYTGVWEEYTITGDADQTINAVYTSTAPEYTLEDPSKITSFPKEVYESIFASPNMTEVIFNDDGSVTFKGTWTETTDPLDPYVSFSYASLMRKYVDKKLKDVPNVNGEYGVLVLKVKMDASVAGNFLMHYAMGRSGAIDGTLNARPDYDAEGTGDYEYIIFDLSYTEFTDDVIGTLRFDWVDGAAASAENVGASMTLYELCLYKDMDEAMAACGMEVETNPPKETDPQETEPQATEPQATEEVTTSGDDSGCKSVVASASIMTVVAAAAALVVLKKKKEDD